jgi:hypothetical protein
MRKPKEQVDEDGHEAQFFDDFESDDSLDDQDDDSADGDPRQRKRPARQRVELRHEQQTLRRQLSDWDDYEQDDFDTKL